MCHAPIVIPPIGRERASDCQASTRAMEQAARSLVDARPETIVVLSPHLSRHPSAFGCCVGEKLSGNFEGFGVLGLDLQFQNDLAALNSLKREAERQNLSLQDVKGTGLDHGALVPLWFVHQAGFKGRVLVLGFPWHCSHAENQRFGACVAHTLAQLDRKWALLASGDMSHALKPGAPSGYHPQAHQFDEALIQALRQGDLGALWEISENLRHIAAEDALDSLAVLMGVLGNQKPEIDVLSYEGPFGVGYGIALVKPHA